MKSLACLHNISRRYVLYTILGVLGFSGTGQAHDVWITVLPSLDVRIRAVINHGHPGDRKAPDPEKLYELRVIEPNGRERRLAPTGILKSVDGIPVLVMPEIETKGQSGTWLIAARYDNGYWVKTEHGHRNTSKLEFPNAPESLHSMKFAKALVAAGTSTRSIATEVMGDRLELIPLDDPAKAPVGGTFRVRVLFEGRPLQGLGVEIGDGITPNQEAQIARYVTNEEGIAELPIEKAGLQLIVVDYAAASPHPDLADKDLLVATLSFVILEKKVQ